MFFIEELPRIFIKEYGFRFFKRNAVLLEICTRLLRIPIKTYHTYIVCTDYRLVNRVMCRSSWPNAQLNPTASERQRRSRSGSSFCWTLYTRTLERIGFRGIFNALQSVPNPLKTSGILVHTPFCLRQHREQ